MISLCDINYNNDDDLIIKEIHEMIADGADVKDKSSLALRMAAYNSKLNVMTVLIDYGASLTDHFNDASVKAAQDCNKKTMKFIYENIDNIEDKMHGFMWASSQGKIDAVKYYNELGVDMSYDNNAAIRYANENNFNEMVKYLKTQPSVIIKSSLLNQGYHDNDIITNILYL